ncbi:ferritin family protein [Hyperthermus butylicus]|uniref:Conserved archaeal protein n=1 Tax=Hyperthermus butylicus (strain DSM 5456 / JCM 9403 / PLM1-5) TaxID=415426 RepID=A2BMZ1_HYPBU|nr:ferritin family protein [Hyperthermus butylicus]ABM81352.1 conserved archaeal protein [Hyperthermus butylicus DSM 5456]
MLSQHPLLAKCNGGLDKLTLAEAVRLAIIGELDAINLYLQIARCVRDEKARKLFEEIAREEKTHVGELLELLRRLDPEQVRELEEGAKEAEELLGEG